MLPISPTLAGHTPSAGARLLVLVPLPSMELIASSGISPSATAVVAPPVIHAGVVMPRPRPRPRGAGMALFARLLEAVRDAAARMPERRALSSIQL